jgi:DNA-directed RNA polymerase specialized sigma24 family protein
MDSEPCRLVHGTDTTGLSVDLGTFPVLRPMPGRLHHGLPHGAENSHREVHLGQDRGMPAGDRIETAAANQSHATLLARARRGDHVAWASLVDRHRAELVLSARYTPHATHEDAEDLVQSALTRAWRLRTSIRPGRGTFAAWVLTILARGGWDSARRQHHQQALLAAAGLAEGDLPGIANGGTSPLQPDEVMAANERAAQARQVLSEALPILTDLEAEVLWHAVAGGRSADFERADGSAYACGAYRQTLHRARRKLRSCAGVLPCLGGDRT